MKLRRVDMAEVDRLRLEIPLSRAALCKRAEISYSTYKYLQAGRSASELVAAKLAKALGVKLDAISTPLTRPERQAS